MLVGVAAATVGVVLYALASILQTIGARRVSARTGASPGLVALLREPVWDLGSVTLVAAFLAFAASTRVLPLVLAVVIRAFYPVLTVVFEHLAFSTRLRALEVLGAAVVLIGPVVIVWSGGERGAAQPSSATTVLMILVVAGVVVLSVLTARWRDTRPMAVGVVQAVLSGCAFTVVDMGVRSLPEPFSIASALGTPSCWVGAVAAPVGLLLFSRAVTSTTAGLATVLLTAVNVFASALWSSLAFGDTSNAGPVQYAAAVIAVGLGLWLMTRPARHPSSN